MTPEQAKGLLKSLGCKPHYDGGPWVKSDCPLAPFTHTNHKDTNPSFGVSVTPDKHSNFNCFTCYSGTMEELVQQLEMYVSKNKNHAHRYDFVTARKFLEDEDVELPMPEFSEFGNQDAQTFYEWPNYFIESFGSCLYSKPAMDYLASRDVTMEQVERHNLRYDVTRKMIVAPYRNVYGLLAGARGRTIQEGMKGISKHYDYTFNGANNAALTWFNEPALDTNEPIIIVEGQFDLFRVERVYPHVVANLTSKPVPYKVKKLQQCSGVLLMLDNDSTADIAIKKYAEYFSKYGIPWQSIQPPKLLDENGKLIKADPDSMGEAWIEDQLKQIGLLESDPVVV